MRDTKNTDDSWYRGYDAGYCDKLNGFMEELENRLLDDDLLTNNCKMRVFTIIKETKEALKNG